MASTVTFKFSLSRYQVLVWPQFSPMLFQYVFLRQMRQYRKPLCRYDLPLEIGVFLLFYNYHRMQPDEFLPPGYHVRICPYINNEWGSTLDCFNIIVCLCMCGQILLRDLRWWWAWFAHHIQIYCFSPVEHIKITWEKIALHFATVQLTPEKLSSFVCRDLIGSWKG